LTINSRRDKVGSGYALRKGSRWEGHGILLSSREPLCYEDTNALAELSRQRRFLVREQIARQSKVELMNVADTCSLRCGETIPG